MPINQFKPAESPIDAISKALGVVHNIYGIQQAGAANDALVQKTNQEATLAERQNKLNSESDSPDSASSKIAQSDLKTMLDYGVQHGIGDKDQIKDLKGLVLGSPEQKDKDGNVIAPAQKGMSASQIDSIKANSSILKLISGQQAAQASANKMVGYTEVKREGLQNTANSAYDRVIGKNYEDRLDAAQRVRDLIQKSVDGTLIPSENLGQQLANDITLLQSQKSTVSGTEHVRPVTLFGNAGKFGHFLSGDPQAAITNADLNQMLKETDALYGDIGQQQKAKFSSWIKGQSKSTQDTLKARFQESREQYFPGGSAGAALNSSPSQQTKSYPVESAHPQDSEAVQWAKSNPDDPRAAKILQVNGVK